MIFYTVLGLVIIIIYIKFSKAIPFLYLNARIGARSNKILSPDDIRKEFTTKDLSTLSKKLFMKDTSSLFEVHKLIEQKYLLEVEELKELSSGNAKKVIEIYELIHDSKILKGLVKQKLNHGKITTNNPAQNIGLVEKIDKIKTLKDLAVILENTKYRKVTSFNSIEEFEKQIDMIVLDSINVSENIFDKKNLNNLFLIISEIQQILMIIKDFIREEKEIMFPDFIKPCKSIEQLVKNIPKYENPLKKAFDTYRKEENISIFEKELKLFLLNNIRNFEIKSNIGSVPIVTYLTKIENQKQNLMILAKAVYSGNKDLLDLIT